MFIYKDSSGVRLPDVEKAKRTELQRKWLAFQRFFNTRPVRVNCAAIGVPLIQVLLNHFYGTEIVDLYRFDNIELTDSVIRNFFDDVKINHLP